MYQQIGDFAQIDASLGVHPLQVKTAADLASVEQLVYLVSQHDKVVAIGESGLDYYYDETTKELQQLSFINHLQVGAKLNMPVIVHTRDAREDTLELIARHGGKAAGVLHCFTESLEMAIQAIDLGYMISISGIVTFKNAAELKEVVRQLPLDKILIETDSPYLAPVPFRGKQNLPKYLVEVAQYVADLKGISIEALADITSQNYYQLCSRSRP
jgi:TatD DNase family protein